MAYTKTTWVNDQTELNAENLNHIEDGIANSQNVELIAISDEAPSECATGDKYYNTDDNKIYTATGTNTWSEDGEEPIRDVFYILFSEQSSYSYDGTTLVSVGGGTEDIVISDEEPTEEGVKIWIDTGEISQQASEITNSYSTSTGIGYSANYVNNLHTYSATEQRIGTWIDGKPLYRKVFNIASPQSSNTNYFDVSGYNIDRVIKVYGYYKNNTGTFDIPMYDSDSNYSVMFISSGNYLRGRLASGALTGITDCKVIVEYTKTTD